MEPSKYTMVSKIKDSSNYLLVNVLYGNADIVEPYVIDDISSCNTSNKDLIEKKYLVNPEEEKREYTMKYLDFIDSRDDDEVQIFFVPHYTCNFDCSYCFQDEYTNPGTTLSYDVVDSFFEYVRKEFAGRTKYITLFGGEPLLPSAANKERIAYFFNKVKEYNLDLAVVTNGYTLLEYIDLFEGVSIRELQVTLDGAKDKHNARRYLKGKGGTFDVIVDGVDAALASGFAVNLRMVVDKDNISDLSELALFAKERGWTANPLFKTQLGRNYELHHCQDVNSLYSRAEMYEAIVREIEKCPEILEFHRPALSISKFLFENGELPDPLFDACTGTKTEWAFDYTGSIYACTATVGKSGEELGTFYPVVTRKNEVIDEWEARDVTSIEKCKDCSVQLACGGGCASVAKNSNNGKILTPDCRPIESLLSLGGKLYFENSNQEVQKCLNM